MRLWYGMFETCALMFPAEFLGMYKTRPSKMYRQEVWMKNLDFLHTAGSSGFNLGRLQIRCFPLQLKDVDESIILLKERALEITDLMGFVSLNMAAVRKILKKIAKNLHSDGPHGPGTAKPSTSLVFS